MTLTQSETLRSPIDAVKTALRGALARVFPLPLEAKIIIGLLALLGLWGLAIASFGVPALVYPMALIVPGMVLSLVLLTWGM